MDIQGALVEPLAIRAETLSDALAAASDDAPDAIHQLRVLGRRVNVGLWAVEHATSTDLTLVRLDVRWLTATVGRARDLEVIASHLDRTPSSVATAERAAGMPALRTALADPRASKLSHRLVVNLDEIDPSESKREAGPAFRSLSRKADKRLRASWADSTIESPPDEALHAMRKSARRARYAAEYAEAVFGDAAADYARELHEVQGLLGEHQDASITLAWLRVNRSEFPAAPDQVARLLDVQRQVRAALATASPPSARW